jgi:hypothetical protein
MEKRELAQNLFIGKVVEKIGFDETLKLLKESIEASEKAGTGEGVTYWKFRCESAEAYIEEVPCHPDIYPKQLKAYARWQTIKNLSK